jgi:hypothetical protein
MPLSQIALTPAAVRFSTINIGHPKLFRGGEESPEPLAAADCE